MTLKVRMRSFYPINTCSIHSLGAAFAKVYSTVRSLKSKIKRKRKFFNEYVLPVMTQGSETWSLTLPLQRHLQWHMERVTARYHLLCLEEKHLDSTGVKDIIETTKKGKHRRSGHVFRLGDNRKAIKHDSGKEIEGIQRQNGVRV